MKAQAIRTIRTLLPESSSVSVEEIEFAVSQALAIPQYAGIDRDDLVQEIQSIYSIHIDNFRVIEADARRRPWLNDKRGAIEWKFWNRYREYSRINKNFSDTVVGQLDRLTDRTLDGLFDPKDTGALKKYGLVVGQVQSGKTSNYTGLICKAADADFKLVIVLAGTLNNLRTQTQLRLDEGFLGFDTQHERAFRLNNLWIGVGNIERTSVAHSLTSSKSDFNAGAANAIGINFNTNEPIIAVVKKNGSVLNKLFTWLSAHAVEVEGQRVIRNKSLLLIDDEADHASINTNKDGAVATKINRSIREILELFERGAYVGYTATPFANIFIPITEDQLFPRDFIVNLPPPSNYIGPEKIFGFQAPSDDEAPTNTLPVVHRIDDFASFVPERHKKDDSLPSEAPESLKKAIRCFVLTCAIRRLRGQVNEHNSMLIHVTRFVRWQKHIKDFIVQPIFDFYRRGIEFNTPEIIEELRATFEDDSDGYLSYVSTSASILKSELQNVDPNAEVHSWNEVLPHLHDAASRIQVMDLNGGSVDVLNYFDHKNGLSAIAIGGDKLSRGLTLEGLSVSYYLRASKMYDTLMQMGRWFGYRPGYVDLCRLFTSRELNEWFCHITLASEELRNEFEYMSDIAGSTPEQYALRVRTHPGVLQISASNKIRNATEVQVSWSGRLVESYELSKSPAIIDGNFQAAKRLINGAGSPEAKSSSYFLWQNKPFALVREFLGSFQVFDNLRSAAPSNLLRFIEIKYSRNELDSWNIGVVTKSSGKECTVSDSMSVNMIRRQQTEDSKGQPFYYIRKSHIISPNDEFIDLTASEREEAMAATQSLWEKNGKEGQPKYPSGEWVRNEIRKRHKRPLLLLYFLDPDGAEMPSGSEPFVGFAISFPGCDTDDAVSYAINEQLLQAFNQDAFFDEGGYDDEDES